MAHLPAGLLGRLAVEQGLITMDQLSQATQEQAQNEGSERLGEVLTRLGFLEGGQVEALLNLQRADLKRIEEDREARETTAEILDEDDWIAEAQAELVAQALAQEAGAGLAADKERATRDWITTVLRQAWQWSATDVHLHGATPVTFRVGGTLHGPSEPMTAQQVEDVVRLLMPERCAPRLEAGAAVAFGMTVEGAGRFRVQAVRGERGVEAALRRLHVEPPMLAELGLPGELAQVAAARLGLVLVAGPARTGKTCVLAALVRIINEERRERIVCIERPVELVHTSDRCVVSQFEVGRDVPSWAAGLEAAIGADADVVVLGDLPSPEVAEQAAAVAESGRLVLACASPTMARRLGDSARAVVSLGVEHPELGDSLIHTAKVHRML